VTRKSGFDSPTMSNDFKGFRAQDPGQNCPQDYPQGTEGSAGSFETALGDPLDIQEVARLLGCSPWTVRHRYLREGLPHFRTAPSGKLIFYRSQVIRWVLSKQLQKGG
jgi:hypothetical protein